MTIVSRPKARRLRHLGRLEPLNRPGVVRSAESCLSPLLSLRHLTRVPCCNESFLLFHWRGDIVIVKQAGVELFTVRVRVVWLGCSGAVESFRYSWTRILFLSFVGR